MQDYETELLQKKKKKLKKIFVVVGDSEDSKEHFIETFEDRIIKFMSKHIGMENQVSNQSLFEYVYRTLFHRFNIYQRFYYWSIIKKIIHKLNFSGKMFIVIKKNSSYVLKSEEELAKFKNRIKNSIIGLKLLEKKAIEWVEDKKYLSLENNN